MTEQFKETLEVQVVVDAELAMETWDDPGDYPSGAGSSPMPSYDYLVVEAAGEYRADLSDLFAKIMHRASIVRDTDGVEVVAVIQGHELILTVCDSESLADAATRARAKTAIFCPICGGPLTIVRDMATAGWVATCRLCPWDETKGLDRHWCRAGCGQEVEQAVADGRLQCPRCGGEGLPETGKGDGQ